MKRPILIAVLAATGCATEPPPAAELASARAAIDQAGIAAPAELQAAKVKLSRAQDAAARGDNVQARRLAQEAEVDARLAWAISENERLRQ
jgi:hypothetical protein